jgi:large subunit ribosomal protein L23
VAFIRTPQLSPYQARFLVPLDFSKYDLRDYLYHAYGVKCFNLRSYVKQMPVRDTREQPRHWFRPESKKYMTVEMAQPFVWPEVPNLEPWGKDQRRKEINDSVAANSTDAQQQIEKLFKMQEASSNEDIEQEQAEMAPLSAEKQKTEGKRMRAKSRLQLWENQRTNKVVLSDGRSRVTA